MLIGTDGIAISPSDLNIVIKEKKTLRDSMIFNVTVSYPPNYPETDFKIMNPSKYISSLLATILTDHSLYIISFYVYTSRNYTFGELVTEDENILTRNLGKRMMCALLNHIVNEKRYLTLDNNVVLEAEGLCQIRTLKEVMTTWSDDDVLIFMSSEPYRSQHLSKLENEIERIQQWMKMKKREDRIKECLNTENTVPSEECNIMKEICKYYQSKKTVENYKTYGLSEEKRREANVDMTGTIKLIMDSKCKDDGGRSNRRRSRKRSVMKRIRNRKNKRSKRKIRFSKKTSRKH